MPGPGSRACPKPERIIDKVRRHIKRRKVVNAEQPIMRAVRREDAYCRFPLCSCGRLRLQLEVAHAGIDGHRGMGGDASGARTTPGNLILLCQPRHRKHKFAVDKKTLRAEPLTEAGLRGPVRWWIDASQFPVELLEQLGALRPDYGTEWVLATEMAPHQWMAMTNEQRTIAAYLAQMTC